MNTIDQRILIPANPDVIWNVISNINDNPKWQVNCQNVSFLTTNHTGQGMRYRATNPKGGEYVTEITAWYENVGYAYKIIDGISTRSNSGRFRLQEITEGTIVQWVFEYEPSGLLGGIKNSLSTKRTFEQQIIKSLENLWRVIHELQAGKPYVSRTAMREAPDVESRAQYKARHDSKRYEEQESVTPYQSVSDILQAEEPPFKQDDTRPHPAEPTPPSAIAPVSGNDIFSRKSTLTKAEPDFLKSLDETGETADHSIFQPPAKTEATPVNDEPQTKIEDQAPDEATQTSESVAEIESLFSFEEPKPESQPASIEAFLTAPILEKADEPIQESPITPEPITPIESETPQAIIQEEAIEELAKATVHPEATETPSEPVVNDGDTSQMSIFEIFGLPKPSETQQMRAVILEEQEPSSATTPATLESVSPSKITFTDQPSITPSSSLTQFDEALGLRVRLRRKNSKVRRRS